MTDRQTRQEVASLVRNGGGHSHPLEVNVTLRTSVDAAMDSVVSHFGTLDFLVNCAGITGSGDSWKIHDDDCASTWGTNLTGAFNHTRAVLPRMGEKGKGTTWQ